MMDRLFPSVQCSLLEPELGCAAWLVAGSQEVLTKESNDFGVDGNKIQEDRVTDFFPLLGISGLLRGESSREGVPPNSRAWGAAEGVQFR